MKKRTTEPQSAYPTYGDLDYSEFFGESQDSVISTNNNSLSSASESDNARPSSRRSDKKTTFKFESDKVDQKSARVTYTNKYGQTYTRLPVEPEDVTPMSMREKNKIKGKSPKDLLVDPYGEFGMKVIQQTEEEKAGFYDFTSKVLKDKPEQFKTLDNYMKTRPKIFMSYLDETEKDSDGTKNVLPMPDDMFKRKLRELPSEIWDNPFCFVRGRFLTLLKWHNYTREVTVNLMGMMSIELKKRNQYTKDDIKFRCQKSGLFEVEDNGIGESKRIPEYIHMVYRFCDLPKGQHEEEKQKNREQYEDFSNIVWESMTSLIEDRVCVNMILIPSYNVDFRHRSLNAPVEKTLQTNDHINNKKPQKTNAKGNASHAQETKDNDDELSIKQKMSMEANKLFAVGCIFYSV